MNNPADSQQTNGVGLLPVQNDSITRQDVQQVQQNEPVEPTHPEDTEQAEEEGWHSQLPAKPKRRSKPADYVGRGRPSKFRRWMLPAITRLAAKNRTPSEIAEYLGISYPRFMAWKQENSEISRALALGEEMALDYVEKGLLKRAVGWVGPAEKVLRDGRVVRHKQFHPPDTAAAMNVLTNRRSDRWKRNNEENPGLAMQVIIQSPRIAAALQRHKETETPALPSVPHSGEEQE